MLITRLTFISHAVIFSGVVHSGTIQIDLRSNPGLRARATAERPTKTDANLQEKRKIRLTNIVLRYILHGGRNLRQM